MAEVILADNTWVAGVGLEDYTWVAGMRLEDNACGKSGIGG